MDPTHSTQPPLILPDDAVRIPAGVHVLEEFRRWCQDSEFPARGRIDYLHGHVEVDMSAEDLFTHGTPKAAIAARLYAMVVESERGTVFIDCTRVVSQVARLSVEPDVVVVMQESVAAGRVRPVPSSQPHGGRYVELEGAPDLVVEIISDTSVSKDRLRLPELYARAGVAELWLVDARGEAPALEIRTLRPSGGYSRVPPDGDGPDAWMPSPLLGCRFRLRRHEMKASLFVNHKLEVAP
ncbi:MAG TPA: Uma2 family endonuclease [Thermoanaerobaculia bacterium]|jgi:Uma2 family endonuclease|nr:Uma2 family endonuclease [Thermoanaerobaculia bacterium]